MTIKVHTDGLKDIQDRLPTEDDARTVSMRAINRAMDAGRVTASREVAKIYTVRAGKVNEKIKVSKASKTNLEASVTWTGRPMNLADFKVSPKEPRPAQRPVLKAGVLKSSGLKPVPGVFVANVKSGRRAFKRTGKPRLPIESVYGPSIPQMLGNQEVVDAVQASEVLDARLEHEITRILDKL